MKRKIYLIFSLLIVFIIANWIYKNSFIEISVTNLGKGQATYVFKNQSSDKSFEVKSSASKIKQRVRKGNYEISVLQPNQSFFAVVVAKGLLKKTTVPAKLSPEKSRTFIGYNPSPCMTYLGDKLVSYTCGDLSQSINMHMPAAGGLPTYLRKSIPVPFTGYVQGIINVSSGIYALVKSTDQSESGNLKYALYHLDNNLNLLNLVNLPSLDTSKQFSVKPSGRGYIVYDLSLNTVLYYTPDKNQPSVISIPRPKNKDLAPVYLDSADLNYAALYASGEDIKTNAKDPNGSSEVILNQSGQNRDLSFKQTYRAARLCEKAQLCMLGENKLDVYDIKSSKPKLMFSMNGIKNIDSSGSSLLIINDEGILNFNILSRSGSYDYTYGDYRFNTIQTSVNNYVLNLTNNKKQDLALLINSTQPDSDSIDKKIAQLERVPQIKNVSIYGSFISIVPNLGEPKYIPDIDGYDYDPSMKQAAKTAIEKAIDQLGINRKAYTISIII
ncbi:MAG TPA: hypothetical protein VFB03_03420 [Candidatus Saccharimonadales bacterium]|nr:hypothetical protein [Candidatus Saccharimonadales bacterium]